MNIKERYLIFANRQNTLNDISEIKNLRDLCLKEMNYEYQYYCDLLLADIYTENNQLDEALNISNKDLEVIDPNIFRVIYLSFLERIIYIYIQKKNYNIAYRYSNMKKKYLDLNDTDEVNRWYLETAYIYAELNDKNKALTNLKAIVNNNPNSQLLSLVYSNMAKLYIDQFDLEMAKDSLNKCLSLVFELNDEEGKSYCDYLLAKLYAAEKNYRYAIKAYSDLFKGKKELSNEYLPISLEYVNLLIELGEIDDANKLLSKYSDDYESCNDLDIKRNYYKSLIKTLTYKNKYVKDIIPQLINKLDKIEEKINYNLEVNKSNVLEDDKNFEVYINMKEMNEKTENMINNISISLVSDNIRDCLIDFGKSLTQIVHFDELQLVILDKSKFEPVIELYDNYNQIDTYQYKKQRLYERQITFNNINNTVVEMLIASRQEHAFDFKDNSVMLLDVINGKSYQELNFRKLLCLPLISDNEIFGAIIYLSENSDISSMNNQLLLKMASKILESKILSLYYQENLRSQKNILQNSLNALQEGIFYNKPSANDLILTNQSQSFLNLDSKRLPKEEFYQMIDHNDLDNYHEVVDTAVDMGDSYKAIYHLNTSKDKLLVEEVSSPYITKNGDIKFYISAFHKLTYAKNFKNNVILDVLKQSDFNQTIEIIKQKTSTIEYKFALIRFKIFDLDKFESSQQTKIINNVHQIILNSFEENVYYLLDKTLVVLIENNIDIRTIEKNINISNNALDKGLFIDEELINFKSSASVIRYPRDSFNIDDIIKHSSEIINSDTRITIFSEDIYKNILRKENVSSIVKSQLVNDNIELLMMKLNSRMPSLEVKYNIKGLTSRDSISDLLNKDLSIEFEKKNLLKTVAFIEQLEYRVFIQCGIATLDSMMKKNELKTNLRHKYQKICLIIGTYQENMLPILKNLKQLGFNIYLDHKLFKKLELGWFINNSIQGIYINEAIESNERVKLLTMFKILNYEILCNYEFSDYDNIVYRTEEIISLKELL